MLKQKRMDTIYICITQVEIVCAQMHSRLGPIEAQESTCLMLVLGARACSVLVSGCSVLVTGVRACCVIGVGAHT